MDENVKIRDARVNPPSKDSAFVSIDFRIDQSEIEVLRNELETHDNMFQEIRSLLDDSKNDKLLEKKDMENKLQSEIDGLHENLKVRDRKYQEYKKLMIDKSDKLEKELQLEKEARKNELQSLKEELGKEFRIVEQQLAEFATLLNDHSGISKVVEEFLDGDLKTTLNTEGNQQIDKARSNIMAIAKDRDLDEEEFDREKYEQDRAKSALAIDLNSHPNLHHALMKASKIFEKAKSECLNTDEGKFNGEIKKFNIDSLINAVVSGIKTSTFGPESLILDIQDLVSALSSCFRACLEKRSLESVIKKQAAFPILKKKPRCIALIQYEFHSTRTSKTSMFRTKYLVDIQVKIKYFVFTSTSDFRLNLYEAERVLKVGENSLAILENEEEI